jgi:uncharacterized surface protein with fasciclin (FAS1) repeats
VATSIFGALSGGLVADWLNHSIFEEFVMKRFVALAVLSAFAFVPLAAHAAECAAAADSKKEKDVVDTAIASKDFQTLVTAVKAAGLVDVLKKKGPYTVFAPTDKAFAKIPKEKLEALLKDKKALADVLTYHVVPGKVLAADVVRLDSAKTVLGKPIKIEVKDKKVHVNNATVTATDIQCANGVIHVIDTVLLPPTE